MIVGLLNELNIVTLFDRGIPNKECIALSVNQDSNLGQYGIMLGVSAYANFARPIKDNLFWFGDYNVLKDDWIFIYTGEGEAAITKSSEGNNIYTIFWGRTKTVFANSSIVPILFRIDAVNIPDKPEDVPQYKSLNLKK